MKNAKASSKTQVTKKNKIILFGLILVVVAMAITLAVAYIIPKMQHQARLTRINQIYTSLNISDEEYLLQDQEVFGEKRVYDWDKSRTFSSSKEYTRGANVDVTVADLDKKIKDAGFTYFDEPYPGSIPIEYHYKSDRNEYIRLSVNGKPVADAFFNTFWMDGDMSVIDNLDPNAGPSNVTIKVNLDDNNE